MYRPTDRFENWFITSLQTDVNDTTTSFRLNKALNVNQCRLVIDPYDETKREIVKVTSVDGNLVYVERGDDNTAPEYHNEGTIVALHVIAADLNDLYADWAEVEADLQATARSALSPELQFSEGRVGVGKVPVSNRKLDVDGDIYSNGVKVLDENSVIPATNVDFTNLTHAVTKRTAYQQYSNDYLVLGSVQICWGMAQFSTTGTTYNFSRAFDGQPIVTITLNDPSHWDPRVTAVTATSFTARQSYSSPLWISWVAIGKAS